MTKRNGWISLLSSGKMLFLGVLMLCIGLILGGSVWVWQGFQPVSSDSEKKIAVVIETGSNASQIAQNLFEKKLIRSPLHFRVFVKQQQLASQLQNGTFTLSPAMSLTEIALRLTKGSDSERVTLKEGWRAAEMGEYLATILPNFQIDSPEYKTECLAYEGYLFPETYFVPREYTTTQMCKLLRQQYGEVVTMKMREDMHQADFKEEQIITLASIVEREAKEPEDMKVVAGILRNRLAIGMPLQVDATLQYIKGYDSNRKTWWAPPLASDKTLESPYNTYQNSGLPPAPISNPGKEAILAATYPTDSENLYYISSQDGSTMYFAQTYEQHQLNIEKYLR